MPVGAGALRRRPLLRLQDTPGTVLRGGESAAQGRGRQGVGAGGTAVFVQQGGGAPVHWCVAVWLHQCVGALHVSARCRVHPCMGALVHSCMVCWCTGVWVHVYLSMLGHGSIAALMHQCVGAPMHGCTGVFVNR